MSNGFPSSGYGGQPTDPTHGGGPPRGSGIAGAQETVGLQEADDIGLTLGAFALGEVDIPEAGQGVGGDPNLGLNLSGDQTGLGDSGDMPVGMQTTDVTNVPDMGINQPATNWGTIDSMSNVEAGAGMPSQAAPPDMGIGANGFDNSGRRMMVGLSAQQIQYLQSNPAAWAAYQTEWNRIMGANRAAHVGIGPERDYGYEQGQYYVDPRQVREAQNLGAGLISQGTPSPITWQPPEIFESGGAT